MDEEQDFCSQCEEAENETKTKEKPMEQVLKNMESALAELRQKRRTEFLVVSLRLEQFPSGGTNTCWQVYDGTEHVTGASLPELVASINHDPKAAKIASLKAELAKLEAKNAKPEGLA